MNCDSLTCTQIIADLRFTLELYLSGNLELRSYSGTTGSVDCTVLGILDEEQIVFLWEDKNCSCSTLHCVLIVKELRSWLSRWRKYPRWRKTVNVVFKYLSGARILIESIGRWYGTLSARKESALQRIGTFSAFIPFWEKRLPSSPPHPQSPTLSPRWYHLDIRRRNRFFSSRSLFLKKLCKKNRGWPVIKLRFSPWSYFFYFCQRWGWGAELEVQCHTLNRWRQGEK